MNKDFEHIDHLIDEVKKDKEAEGANSSMLNRYPVRFVLFEIILQILKNSLVS